VHFPKSCLHCDNAPCVTVCPTGASYKRSEDGIVLVNEDACIGCGLCAWACPYGAREMDGAEKVMKKCTLCVDRIYNDNLPEEDREPACVRTCPSNARHFGDLSDPDSDVSKLVAAREGFNLMPEQGTAPVNKYLPPRARDSLARWRSSDMHPAPSLIIFTTLSGLSFGLLAWLGFGLKAPTGFAAIVFFGLAYGLAGIGLMAAAFHLGHPERALLAFTQWRSSWLSREAVLSAATLAVMAPHAAASAFWDMPLPVLGWIGGALSLDGRAVADAGAVCRHGRALGRG